MAEKLEIEFAIAPDGAVTIETRGLKGEACLEETKALEARLGRVTAREKTSEYYQRATSTTGSIRRR